jgi:hypothetical protein
VDLSFPRAKRWLQQAHKRFQVAVAVAVAVAAGFPHGPITLNLAKIVLSWQSKLVELIFLEKGCMLDYFFK